LRSTAEPGALTDSIRQAALKVDAGVPAYGIETMDQLIAGSLEPSPFNAFLMSVFASVALLLAAVGVHGVLSYLVAQCAHEIGIRLALGAQRGDVWRLVIEQGMRLTLIGISVSVVGALSASRLLSSFLFGIKATDFTTMTSVSCLLIAVAFLASYVPARRAAKVDPMEALRNE
jgi:putative ABC transport system permease protein